MDGDGARAASRWSFPALDLRHGADPTWAETLDTLRPRRQKEQKPWEWRRDSPPRPVVFRDSGTLDEDAVHLHLSHRVVQRLLGRFLAQGFVHDDLSRACLLQSRDAIPRVVLLGRLSLFGDGAARLHDEVLAVPARWSDPATRKEPLKPYADAAAQRTIQLLRENLSAPAAEPSAGIAKRLIDSAARDTAELLPSLHAGASRLAEQAAQLLTERGSLEALEMEKILEQQKKSIERSLAKAAAPQLELGFSEEERRQLEADKRHWATRLAHLDEERVSEPGRIRSSYQVRAQRVEPVGLVYLWPVSG